MSRHCSLSPLAAGEQDRFRGSCTADIERTMQELLLTGAHGVAPSRDFAHGASGGTAAGQSHRLHVLVDGGGLAQLDEHDVVVDVVGAVVGVADDTGGADILLGALIDPDVVLAHTHLHTAEQEREGCFDRDFHDAH